MTTSLKLRRGTTAQHASFTGAEGEVTVDTTKDTVVVHDGATAGGFPLAKEKFLSAGTGAVARTVDQKLKDLVSVKDFGALGDGSTNDAVAIQNAITFASINNKAVLFPSGVYISNAAITQTNLSVTIYGEGLDNTVVRFTNAASAGFDFAFRAQGVGRAPDVFTLSNITIESDCAFTGNMISAVWDPLQATASPSICIESVRVTSRENTLTGKFGRGIYVKNAFNGFMKNVWVLGDEIRSPTEGIMLQCCVAIKSVALDINRVQTGFKVYSSPSENQCEGNLVAGSFIYDVSVGVYVEKTIHTFLTDIHTNVNGPAAAQSVYFKLSAQCHLSGSLIYSGGSAGNPSGQQGVVIESCNTTHLTANTVIDAGAGNTANNLVVLGGSIDCIFTNNYFGGGATAVFFGTSADTRNTLAHNRLSSGGVVNNGTWNVITGNTIGSTGNMLELAHSTAGNAAVLQSKGSDTNVDIDVLPKGTGKTNFFCSGKRAEVNASGLFATAGGIGWNGGNFTSGAVSSDASWGAYLRGRSGTVADVSLVTSGGKNIINVIESANAFYPGIDNTYAIGTAGLRYTTVYASTGTINTSDSREKQQVRPLSEAEHAVAVRLKQLIRAFKFNNAVDLKGEGARIHFGVIAQDVKAAFEAEGLVAERYALLCYDEWDEQEEVLAEDGSVMQAYRPAGNRYGVRYEELLAFIISVL